MCFTADNGPDDRRLSLVELDTDGSERRRREESVGVNTAVRSMDARHGALWLAGHFQRSVGWGGQSAENDGAHGMFVVVQPIE